MDTLSHYFIALLFAGCVDFSLAVFVFFKDVRNRLHQTFALYFASVGIWAMFEAFAITAYDEGLALLLWRINHIGVIFIPVGFMHFVYTMTNIKKQKTILISYIIAFIFVALNCTNLFIYEVVPKFSFRYVPNPGIFYYVFIAMWISWVAYALFKIFRAYYKSTGIKNIQMKYCCWGMLLAYIGGIPNFLPVFNIEIPILMPFGTYAVPIFAFFMVYLIIYHGFMDINIVIRKTAIYSILATVITIAYFLLIYIMETLFRGFMGYKSIPWTLSVIVIFSLIFQPLKNLVQSFVDKYFFKGSLAEELEKAQEQLKRAERLKAVGTLAAGMAHEIKNPLTGIKTFTEYLPAKYKDPEFIEKFHKIVGSEVNKINDIVQQLLNFSKPKPLKLEKTNIHILIDQTLSFLNNEFLKYHIKVIKNYDNSSPLLNIDPNQIKQVFLNIFLNAIDAMKGGGKLTIATKLVINTVEVTISDTGKGISKKDIEHIFDPFYSTKEKGTGLGMSIVYGIIKEHKGEINVEGEAGKGTTIKISIMTK